ncbi:MAG: hypothetical protein HQ518_22355 [Rhodopirellula sp.]|nr:hypothetical protein [Rhodopirellula sp.]
MGRFTIFMLDLMTVLLLTVIVLIAEEKETSVPAGDVDLGFVSLSARVTAAPGDLDSFTCNIEGQKVACSLVDLKETTKVSADQTPAGTGVFAAIDFRPTAREVILRFSAYYASSFEKPLKVTCQMLTDGESELTLQVVSIKGKEERKPQRLPSGQHTIHFIVEREGSGLRIATNVSRGGS